ncbi:MAG: sigma-54-dependent transcriptional regulator [bacterium]
MISSEPIGENLFNLLIVDDEESVRDSLELLLEESYRMYKAADGKQALARIEDLGVDLVILDVTMPGMDGMETLSRIMELPAPPEVIMLSATDSARLGIQAVKEGAYDYLAKPFDKEELKEVIKRALERRSLEREVSFLRTEVEKLGGFGDIVGRSPMMLELFMIVEKVAQTDTSVLLSGESGTGKELVARAIHSRGKRKKGPFIPINCAAIPRELMESEFFGHEKGAFTGAHARKIGKFELANGGIFFLDEISTLQQELQAKLLRVLQDREFVRVGGTQPIRGDVQIIAASNRDLGGMVAEGQFREDLFYRLNVIPINLPPLRDRRQDIPLLVKHFLTGLCERLNKTVPKVSREAIKVLKSYRWPGNARELENLLERIVVLSPKGADIDVQDLPMEITVARKDPEVFSGSAADGLMSARDRFEKMYILSALRKTDWNQSEAAKLLKVHRNTLHKKMTALGIVLPEG